MDSSELSQELSRVLRLVGQGPSPLEGPRAIDAGSMPNLPMGTSIWKEGEHEYRYVRTDCERGAITKQVTSADPYEILFRAIYPMVHAIASRNAINRWDGKGDYRQVLFHEVDGYFSLLGEPYLTKYIQYKKGLK